MVLGATLAAVRRGELSKVEKVRGEWTSVRRGGQRLLNELPTVLCGKNAVGDQGRNGAVVGSPVG